jgi:hypothetical protein
MCHRTNLETFENRNYFLLTGIVVWYYFPVPGCSIFEHGKCMKDKSVNVGANNEQIFEALIL